MEQYLALTRGNQAPGMAKPKIGGNVNFEIKSQFMRELREDTFSRNKGGDAHEHVEKILDIVSLFNIPGVSHDAVMLRGLIPNKIPGQALEAIQTMVDHSQKWHDGSNSRKVNNGSSDGIAAIINKLDSLGRDMKKLKENVHAIQVGCETCGGSHLDKECPLHGEVKTIEEVKYGKFGTSFRNNSGNRARYRVGPPGYGTRMDDRPPSGERKPSLTEIINKYMEESAKKQAEHDEWLRKFHENM
ncbi:hypothetical protein Tco_0266765 [Tanacetum coccineum]